MKIKLEYYYMVTYLSTLLICGIVLTANFLTEEGWRSVFTAFLGSILIFKFIYTILQIILEAKK